MKRFNIISIVFLTIFLITVFIGNTVIISCSSDNSDKGYTVEINRIMNDIVKNTKDIKLNINLSSYKYINAVEFISSDSSADKLEWFYDGFSVKPGNNYAIKPIIKNGSIKYYARFEFKENPEDYKKFIIIFNTFLIIMFILVLSILIYIRHNIIKPFSQVSNLPYELSKGHLSNNINENRNKFFGKFLWGLDLLRDTLEKHKKRELELEREKKLMILSISHDIKTPLSSIKLYSKALYDNLYEGSERRTKAAKSIEEKADEIEHFVSEIVNMSKSYSIAIEVKNSEFYLKDLILKVNKNYSEKMTLLKIIFEIESYENKLLIGDIDRLLEVIENIIENAIKYGDGKNINISFREEDYSQLITITNTGIPLPPSESIHIFESFYRGSNAHNKNGSGLGLYICKQIMHKIGGNIYSESTSDSMSITIVIREV